MLVVSDIWDDAKKIFGHCDREILLRDITDAVELLANKGECDPLIGGLDICVDGQCVTLPREVETPLGVNIGGHPALGRDQLFSFHLNGPGDFSTPCNWEWADLGTVATYRDLRCPSRLVSSLDNPEDAGKVLRVFGYDEQNRPLRTKVGDTWEDGYLVPTIYGYSVPASTDPVVARITWIQKGVTVANMRLSSYDLSSSTGTLLGVFEPDETLPSYRRIKISSNSEWCRIIYRRRTLQLRSTNDRILLHSRPALLLAMRAVAKYSETDIPNALTFEAQATRLLTEKENVISPPTLNPIQVSDRATSLRNDGLDNID